MPLLVDQENMEHKDNQEVLKLQDPDQEEMVVTVVITYINHI